MPTESAERSSGPSVESATRPGKPTLRRNLKLWQVVAVSIGVMAPSFAINLEPQGMVGQVGRAVPLTYLLALVAVLFVSYSFGRLAQQLHHPGAVYGLVGATVGPRPGVISAWALTGTYAFYSVLTSMGVGIFGSSLLTTWGIWHNPPNWAAYLLAAATLLVCLWLAIVPTTKGTGVVLACEALTVALITLTAVVVFVKLIGGSAPDHHTFTMSVFSPSAGTGTGKLFTGVIFGFLSFAGFEAASVFGGEAKNPRRNIPRAIIGTTAVIGVFYVFVATAEAMGFGTSPKDVAAFGASPSLVGDLGSSYIAHWFGDLITVGTVISAFSCTLACIVGASRMVYTLARDASNGTSPVAKLSKKYDTPLAAAVLVTGLALIAVVIFGWATKSTPIDVFDWTASIGTLLLLVVYLLVTIGAVKLLFFSGRLKVPAWEAIVPALGGLVVLYTLYKNLHPTGAPVGESLAAGIWILLPLAVVLLVPGASARLGRQLTLDEGLQPVDDSELPTQAGSAEPQGALA